MATIKIPAVKSTVSVTNHTITFVDGTVINLTGSNTIATRKAAYLKAKENTPPVEPPKPVEPPIVIVKPSPGTAREIGNKELAVLKDVQNENFVCKAGTYTNRSDWANLNNVNIDMSKVEFQTGRRAIQLNGGGFKNVTLDGFSAKNIDDQIVAVWDYGNTENGQIDGITLKNVKADNCGPLFHSDGDIINGKQLGLVKNLVIRDLLYKNAKEPRSVVYAGNVQGFDIFNCVIDNVNMTFSDVPNGAHNGIFQLRGNGKFHHNKITNHQGNVVRAWLHSQDSNVPLSVEIYNNIVWNCHRYSAFELQVTPSMADNGANYANAKVYNNTAGKINNIKIWEGQMLDLYQTGGTLEYYNNLGFEMVSSRKITDMINHAGGYDKVPKTNIIKNDKNPYFEKWEQAVGNLTTFKSLHSGIGAQ